MAAHPIPDEYVRPRIAIGVGTHKHLHVALARDEVGRKIGDLTIATTPQGYRQLIQWAESLGEVVAFGVEGTGSYGLGLTRALTDAGHTVREVARPNRQNRRRAGKSDFVDADSASKAVLSGDADVTPKQADGLVETIRVLRVARSSAIKACSETVNAIHALIVTAPDELRSQLRGLSTKRLVRTCAELTPEPVTAPAGSARTALHRLGTRYLELKTEIKSYDTDIAWLTKQAAPELVNAYGVGPEVAATLLTAAGDNPDRLRSEASFANLTGVAPIQASSGKTVRHRLNRGGDRDANAALHRIVFVRMRFKHPATTTYLERRIADGKTKREAIRCLKRFVAREVYQHLRRASTVLPPPAGP